MNVYVDASTLHNGFPGKQRTWIIGLDQHGSVLFKEFLGDTTNNEGELVAIQRVLEMGEPVAIFSDSRIAVNWVNRGRPGKAATQYTDSILDCHELLGQTESTLEWIPREKNLAGIYFEDFGVGAIK